MSTVTPLREYDPVIGCYLRISDLTDESTSIATQRKGTLRHAEVIGGQVHRVYVDEDKSGWNPKVKRPEWDEALADLRANVINTLIVYKVDRATRQGIPRAAEIIEIIEQAPGRRFVSVTDGIDSRNPGWQIQLVLMAQQARNESDNASTRMTGNGETQRDDGRWHSGARYGFTVTPERRLAAEPTEAQRVRVMARLLVLGVPAREVARYANRRGWDSPRWAARRKRVDELRLKLEPVKADKLEAKPIKSRNEWNALAVVKMVTSPVMVGHLPHAGESYRHSQTGEIVTVGEPLLPVDVYARLRLRFDKPPAEDTDTDPTLAPAVVTTLPTVSVETGRRVSALLTDLLWCGECGARMVRDQHTRRAGSGGISADRVVVRYRCPGRKQGTTCPGVSLTAGVAETIVGDLVLNRVTALSADDPAVTAIAEAWRDQRTPDRAARLAALGRLIKDETAFLDQLENEKLRGVMYQGPRGEERFRKQYTGANARLDRHEAELAALRSDTLDIGFLDHLPELIEAWKQWSMAERRAFLGPLVRRVWVRKAPGRGARTTAAQVTVWWTGEPQPAGTPATAGYLAPAA